MPVNLILNPSFEIPGGGGVDVFADWTELGQGGSTINQDAGIFYSGANSCRFDIAAGNGLATVGQIRALGSDERCKVALWYYNSLVGKTSMLRIADSGYNVYLHADGTWGVPSTLPIANALSWTQFEMEFVTHPSYTDYYIQFLRNSAASSSIWLDLVSVEALVTVDWGAKVIYVPKNYLTSLGSEVYELDLDQLRLDLKDLEDDEEGMPFPDTHYHNTEVLLSGTTYARFLVFINGYTVTFEDGQYAVNAKGANTNLADVMNVNQVSLRSFNSAGLITVTQAGSGLSTEEHDKLMAAAYESGGRLEDIDDATLAILSDTAFIKHIEGGKWEISGSQMIFYQLDNITEVARFDLTYDVDGNPIMRERV